MLLLCWATRDFVGEGGVIRNRKQKETAGYLFYTEDSWYRALLYHCSHSLLLICWLTFLVQGSMQACRSSRYGQSSFFSLTDSWLGAYSTKAQMASTFLTDHLHYRYLEFGDGETQTALSIVVDFGSPLQVPIFPCSPPLTSYPFFLPDHLILWFWVVSKWLCFCAQTWLNQADKFGPYLIF